MAKKKLSQRNKRPSRKVALVPKTQGKGFYKGFLSDVGNVVGSLGGALIGMPSGGRKVGGTIGDFISKATGFGDYKVSGYPVNADTGPPVFRNGAEGTVTVNRREYIMDVISSQNFSSTSFNLNAGNPSLFPWLSNLGQTFEQYEFIGLIFEYRPTSGNAVSNTNNALGTVVMATNYDVLDSPFPDKRTMEAYQYCVSTVPSCAAIHPVECKKTLNVLSKLYMRHPIVPLNADLRFYDLGLFQIATVGMQASGITVGELWVSYSIRLIKPKLPPPLFSHYISTGTASYVKDTGLTAGIVGGITSSTLTLISAGLYNITTLNFVNGTSASNAQFTSGVVVGTNSSICAGWVNESQPQGVVNNGFIGSVSTSGAISTSTSAGAVCSTVICVNNGGDTVNCPVASSLSTNSDLVITYLGYVGAGTHAF